MLFQSRILKYGYREGRRRGVVGDSRVFVIVPESAPDYAFLRRTAGQIPGMYLAALNINYRDVKYALPFGIQLLLFLTPIIYPTSIIPEKYQGLMALNPLTGIIEACRASLLPTHSVDWKTFGISAVITAVIFVAGAVYFHRTQRSFADVV